MLYQRSLAIENRLETVLRLIGEGRYSTPMLAQELGVSIPTISRCVTALRERGHQIRSECLENGWCYILDTASPGKPTSLGSKPHEARA